MPFGKQSGEGAALPVAPAETVKGSGRRGGAARSPATGEDTARLDDDARNGRRLPLDRLGRGCVADRKTKRLRTGVSGRQPVDPPERQMDHPGPRLARASPVSSACRSSQTGREASRLVERLGINPPGGFLLIWIKAEAGQPVTASLHANEAQEHRIRCLAFLLLRSACAKRRVWLVTVARAARQILVGVKIRLGTVR